MIIFLKKSKRIILLILGATILIAILFFVFFSFSVKDKLFEIYTKRESVVIKDRNEKNILIKQNSSLYYASYIDKIPENFEKLLLLKEDKYFYRHNGINPFSILRALFNYSNGKKNLTSSTITQQLAKILLSNEFDRSLKNKLKETIYAFCLEINFSKKEILKMYINSIYFGNGVQGLKEASRLYFDLPPEMLTDEQNIQLLATINNPSNNNPFSINNLRASNNFSKSLGMIIKNNESLKNRKTLEEKFNTYTTNKDNFEMESLQIDCEKNCKLTIDLELTKTIRDILKNNLQGLMKQNVSNGAVIVIKIPENKNEQNELLAIVGSPDPSIDFYGYKINMAIKPRPIGSTIKPLIYLKGFQKGLRPYTLVEDREYKYIIDSGFNFYPKNYDYEYRGEVNLHYALANSLNVPTVKILEYVGIEDFSNFLLNDLEFNPVQKIENYQLSIALGGLETDLLSLAYYFSIFANDGDLKPLKVYDYKNFDFQAGTNYTQNKKISDPQFIALINNILSDRKTGIEQFGIKSNLNLYSDNYAVKTGTSREYHDSWTVGYTKDFIVGVWIGNSDDTAMDKISGQNGAGKTWQDVMNLLINSEYNKKNVFDFSLLENFYKDGIINYGLKKDDYEKHLNLLIEDNLILVPHNGDVFLLEKDMQIPLRAREETAWYINEELLGKEREIIFKPKQAGEYNIKGIADGKEENIILYINKEE